MEKVKKRWSSLSRPVRVVISLMSFLKMDFDKLSKIRIDDIDAIPARVVIETDEIG